MTEYSVYLKLSGRVCVSLCVAVTSERYCCIGDWFSGGVDYCAFLWNIEGKRISSRLWVIVEFSYFGLK